MYRRNQTPAFAERKSARGFRQSYAYTVCCALSWGVVLAFGIKGVDQLLRSRLFSVQHVVVRGEYSKVPLGAVRQALTPALGVSLWVLPMDQLAKRVQWLSPWIDSVSVRRLPPHDLVVDIHQRRAVAYLNQNALIDEHMQVFTPKKMATDEMVRLYGPEDQVQALWDFASYSANIVQSLGWVIDSVRLGRFGFSIHTRQGIEIVVGKERAHERLERLVKAYPSIKASEHVLNKIPANIDLRYANGLAIQWKVQDRSITS